MGYVSLELSLQVVFVIVDDSLIGDRYENFFSLSIGEVVDAVEDVVVESECPLEFESTGFAEIFLFGVVLAHVSYRFKFYFRDWL